MGEIMELAARIVAGHRLKSADECRILIEGPLDEVTRGADHIRAGLCGGRIDLCCIVNGRSGRCSEDCKFCAQSGHNHTGIREYPFLAQEAIVADCRKYYGKGIDRYSIVTAGRSLRDDDLESAVAAYERLHKEFPGLRLCGSHGMETPEAFARIRAAGVDTVHCNLETSRRFFPQICTTHTFEDKLETIRRAKAAGLKLCCGGIIGMGETWDDRVDMALEISRLDVETIPLNMLVPIKGTPLENRPILSNDEMLRTVAIFRFVNPTSQLRIAAGRYRFDDGGAVLFRAGANAAITGDMLTTSGTKMDDDRAMFRNMGFKIREAADEE